MAMTPEGAEPIAKEEGAAGGVAEGLQSLVAGTQSLAQALGESGAPPEAVKLAETAAGAMTQLAQMMTGGGQPEGPGRDVGVGGLAPSV